MHTWETKNHKQRVGNNVVNANIDYEEYKCLHPNVFQRDSQEAFLETVHFDDYFYRDIWEQKGESKEGEWIPELVQNHLCALESIKRGYQLVKQDGNRFRYVMFVRPDCFFHDPLPFPAMGSNVILPKQDAYEGYNDRFAVVPSEYADIYASRLDGLKDFRQTQGRIVSEKYLKYVLDTHEVPLQFVSFRFDLVRPRD
jgi:hypothetical protein